MIKDWSEAILNSVFDIIIVVDDKLTIVDVNDASASIGYSLQDLTGKSIYSLTPDPTNLQALFKVVIDDNGIDRELKRMQVMKGDGSTYYADVGVRKIPSTVEEDFLVVMHDVDDRAKARQALEEQKRIVEEALQQADDLRREAEESRLQLEVANVQLARKQEITEAELEKEQTFRLTTQKTGFQKDLTRILAILIALALILPYLSGFLVIETKVLDGSNNLGLLLLQILGVAVGYLFGGANGTTEKKDLPGAPK